MKRISSLIRLDKEYRDFSDTLAEAYRRSSSYPIVVNGLTGGSEDAFLAEGVIDAVKCSNTPVLVLCGSEEQQLSVYATLSATDLRVRRFPGRNLVFNNITSSHDVERERLDVLYSIAKGVCDVVVASSLDAAVMTMPREVLLSSAVSIKVGDVISPSLLAEKLSALGFARVDIVDGAGQFSARGDILDFWHAQAKNPIRVEFFGDEIDRLCYFDPVSQRSVENCRETLILPGREVILNEESRGRVKKLIKKLMENTEISEQMRARLNSEYSILDAGLDADFRDKYISLIYERATLFDYLGEKGIVFLVGTNGCYDALKNGIAKYSDDANGLTSYGAMSEKYAKYSLSFEEFENALNVNLTIHLNPFAGGIGNIKLSGLFGFRSRRTVSYGNNFGMLKEDLNSLRRGLYRTVVLAANKSEAESLEGALAETDIAAIPIYDNEEVDVNAYAGGSIFIDVSTHQGFDLVSPKIAVLSMKADTGKAVMANKRKQRIARKTLQNTQRLMSHQDLKLGDYVVHANYGIGLFEGIETVTAMGVTKDYITIQYAGTDKLFVPCDKLDMIGKYIGARDDNGTVKLSKMGGGDWLKSRAKAKSSAKDIAKELIALYAERQRRQGFAFPKHSSLEDEFAASFEYEETDSQLTSINEIEIDMMRSVPMNRLLCGDVGFGKTEVALRAAFKAVLAGKQVAILVPTTILALQHYQTTLSRMRGYAVSVEMLSRFRTPKQRAEILDRVKRGRVDILIGTHAILGKNMEFKDLGLLIIDEEQRFGVAQKEKLRKLATNVDTLMLSATPIPRTLNMAMSGINDISVLEEAPSERRPVQTYVMEHDDAVIIDAISRELSRGGQVLYLYNKVEDIDLVAGRIMEALPEARVAYAHGKLDKDEIEDIWQSLVRGEVDVLVCTTIIETGVDLPNANTLIIENADRFGLSQLHQIRGRVGRSERQAYAYFTFRKGKALSEVAEKRLSAIREFAGFGAGFNIAMRDLEIRGAGNLLGAEQHGYIESVGYDLYIKLLNEAVLEERGEVSEKFESQIAINVSAYIPESYISAASGRMEMYKKISLIENEADRDEIYDELTDRYGNVPKVCERLLDVALVKSYAANAKIRKIEAQDARLIFIITTPDLEAWSLVFAKFKNMSFLGLGSPNVVYRLRRDEDATSVAKEIMCAYIAAMNECRKENQQ